VTTSNSFEKVIPIRTSADVLRARQACRDVAGGLGFEAVDQTRLATAISEITRNVLQHSGATGEVRLEEIRGGEMRGIVIVVKDVGCGIADLALAMGDCQSSLVLRLGAGLPSSKRLMDDFRVDTAAGKGTTVRMVKWLRPARGSDS
jgi:serine/threonine-protein kinase RsbT